MKTSGFFSGRGPAIALATIPALALAGGLGAMALSRSTVAHWFFVAGIVAVLAALLASIVKSLARGQFGLDIIAALSMSGALYAGEALAGVVVALMYAGGQLLEDFAQGRAQREMTALLGRVARTAQVYGGNGRIDRIEHGTDVIAGKASAQLFHARHEFFQNVHQLLESERRLFTSPLKSPVRGSLKFSATAKKLRSPNLNRDWQIFLEQQARCF